MEAVMTMDPRQLAELAEAIAANLQPFADRARQTVDTARNDAEAHALAHELAALLHGSDTDLNNRARLILRCPKGKAAYRVFDIQGRWLGVSAHEPWLAGSETRWIRLPDWLPTTITANGETFDGRCRCCRRPHRVKLTQITTEIKAGRRSALITAVRS